MCHADTPVDMTEMWDIQFRIASSSETKDVILPNYDTGIKHYKNMCKERNSENTNSVGTLLTARNVRNTSVLQTDLLQ
jgi:hypothetical protein